MLLTRVGACSDAPNNICRDETAAGAPLRRPAAVFFSALSILVQEYDQDLERVARLDAGARRPRQRNLAEAGHHQVESIRTICRITIAE
jgi:hypothetical protein